MKRNILITMLLVAVVALPVRVHAVAKIKSTRVEVKQSIRMIDPEDDSDSQGYKMTKTVHMNWPVTVNGKHSEALSHYVLDSLFHAYESPKDFNNYEVTGGEDLANILGDWVDKSLRSNSMLETYIIKEVNEMPELNEEEYPMSCWYQNLEFGHEFSEGDLAFFAARYEDYYGGAHGMFATIYYPFDTRLDKPISIKDIVTNEKAVLRMLPSYDGRPKENQWWDNITDIDNFYIRHGKITFVFSPYAVGPFCDGEVEVDIPLSVLKSKGLLTAYGKTFVKTNSKRKRKK